MRKIKSYNPITFLYNCFEYQLVHFNTTGISYVLVPTSVFEGNITSQQLALYLYLSKCSFKGEAYPKLEKIREDAGLSKSTIVKGTKVLKEQGYLTSSRYEKLDGHFGHNHYFIMRVIIRAIGEKSAYALKAFIEKFQVITTDILQYIKAVIAGKVEAPIPEVLPDKPKKTLAANSEPKPGIWSFCQRLGASVFGRATHALSVAVHQIQNIVYKFTCSREMKT